MATTRKSEQGFSLVEMAIVMVIIGLIVAAVTVGKGTMKGAETLKAYQKVVVPCVSALNESIQRGANATPTITSVSLDAQAPLTCTIDHAAGTATIGNSTADLNALMAKNLNNDAGTSSAGGVVTVYVPGTAPAASGG